MFHPAVAQKLKLVLYNVLCVDLALRVGQDALGLVGTDVNP